MELWHRYKYPLHTPAGTIRRKRVDIRPAVTPQSESGGTDIPSSVPTLPCVTPVLPNISLETAPQNMTEEPSLTEPSHPPDPVNSVPER